jgi:hypothetical protein
MIKLTPEQKAERKKQNDKKANEKRKFTQQKRAEQLGFRAWRHLIAALYDGKIKEVIMDGE